MHQTEKSEATDQAITVSPCGLDNVNPPGDQAINQQWQAGGEVDEQPQQGPFAIHAQPVAMIWIPIPSVVQIEL